MSFETITLPMEVIARHTVAVGRNSAHCMSCGANYMSSSANESRICKGCGNPMVFAASMTSGLEAMEVMQSYADRAGLVLIGYTDGASIDMGGGVILNEGDHEFAVTIPQRS